MSDELNKRKFSVDPADIIRAVVREHERQHGYFNVVDNMVNTLDQQIRIWYEFERKFESMRIQGDITVEEGLELPPDIGGLSPLDGRTLVEPGVAPTKPPIAVDIPQWIPADDEPDEGI